MKEEAIKKRIIVCMRYYIQTNLMVITKQKSTVEIINIKKGQVERRNHRKVPTKIGRITRKKK